MCKNTLPALKLLKSSPSSSSSSFWVSLMSCFSHNCWPFMTLSFFEGPSDPIFLLLIVNCITSMLCYCRFPTVRHTLHHPISLQLHHVFVLRWTSFTPLNSTVAPIHLFSRHTSSTPPHPYRHPLHHLTPPMPYPYYPPSNVLSTTSPTAVPSSDPPQSTSLHNSTPLDQSSFFSLSLPTIDLLCLHPTCTCCSPFIGIFIIIMLMSSIYLFVLAIWFHWLAFYSRYMQPIDQFSRQSFQFELVGIISHSMFPILLWF